jgi:hypothetical protein
MPARRYERTEQLQPGIVDNDAGRFGRQLAETLGRWNDQMAETQARRRTAEGAQAGEAAGTRGDLGKAKPVTFYDRAFSEAAMVAHQAAVQTDIRDSVGRFAIESPDDPDAFDAKMQGLSDGLLKEADPRMAPFIEQRLADYGGRAKLQVLGAQQDKLRKESISDLTVGAQTLFDDATTAAYEGNFAMAEARRQEYYNLLERGEAGGLVDKAKANELRANFEREVTSQDIVGNFDRLLQEKGSDAGTAAIRRWQGQKGSELGLTSEDHERVTQQMVSIKNRFDSLAADERSKAGAAVRGEQLERKTRVEDAIRVMREGYAPTAQEAKQATNDLAWLRSAGALDPTDAVQAAELSHQFNTAAVIQGQVHTFRRMTEQQRAAELTKLRVAFGHGGATADQVELLKALESTDGQVTAAVKKDARGYLAGEGLIEQTALDMSGPEALIDSLQARGSGSAIGRQLVGEPISRLTAPETDQFVQIYNQAQLEQKTALLGILSAGAKDEAEATLKQLDAQGHKGLALLGNMVREGSGQLARDIMLGEQVRGAVKEITPKRTDYQADLDATLGSALIDWPDQRALYVEAALSKYAQMKAQAGDATDAYNGKLFEQAMNQVLPTAEFNGRRVALPAQATEDSFDGWMDSLTDSDFTTVAGRPDEGMAALVKRRGRLVELGNGRYGVALGSAADQRDRYLLNHRGEPFILEYGQPGPRTEPRRGRPAP